MEYTAANSATLGTRLTSGITIVNTRRIRPMATICLYVRRIDQLQMLCALEISIEPPVEISRSGSSIARSKDVGGRACLPCRVSSMGSTERLDVDAKDLRFN